MCFSVRFSLLILHQHHGEISEELLRSLQTEQKKNLHKVLIFNIPDIRVVSPPCGPGDVSGGGPTE